MDKYTALDEFAYQLFLEDLASEMGVSHVVWSKYNFVISKNDRYKEYYSRAMSKMRKDKLKEIDEK